MDLDTYFKVRNTTREQFIEDEVKPVARKRLERSLILDEIVRTENLRVENEELDAEFNQTLNALSMQGLDLGKIRGGRKGQQRVAQAVAMESANRVLTRRALDLLKSIAMGEYKPTELAKSDMISEGGPVEPVESEEKTAETGAGTGSDVSAPSMQEEGEKPANEVESSPSE
jgi:FKBP-type peptidyl-prolyl cis-trans isomerase (trigger factor)